MTEKESKAPARQVAAVANKVDGTIVYNPFLDSWRCIDKNGREVLSVGTKKDALKAYPNFKVKE